MGEPPKPALDDAFWAAAFKWAARVDAAIVVMKALLVVGLVCVLAWLTSLILPNFPV